MKNWNFVLAFVLIIAFFGVSVVNVSFLNYHYMRGYTAGLHKRIQYILRNPTFEEMNDFILWDKTDKNRYSYENFTCLDFAANFKNNAFQVGYRCGFVYILFGDENVAHSINCFDTIDKGLFYVEPQFDEIVNLTIGKSYWNTPRSYNDTVVRWVIFW